jgi:hypothetical protein
MDARQAYGKADYFEELAHCPKTRFCTQKQNKRKEMFCSIFEQLKLDKLETVS